MSVLAKKFSSEIKLINAYLEKLIPPEKEVTGLKELSESMRYSLNNPGKRFRAILSLLTARALEFELNLVLPYGASVELIHTYSLVHDDLPCMDNDDYRRGLPSNHKVYGEGMAVIAGDALVTQAFAHIADSYSQMPRLALRAMGVLASAAGYKGMIGGQAMDIVAKEGHRFSAEEIKKLHGLKTGALIRAATEGSAILCEASEAQIRSFSRFGELLGMAFQVADDILDHDEKAPEPSGLPMTIGLDETRKLLSDITDQALNELKDFGVKAQDLRDITEFNFKRTCENFVR